MRVESFRAVPVKHMARILVFLSALVGTSAFAQSTPGKWWNALSAPTQKTYLNGYLDGMKAGIIDASLILYGPSAPAEKTAQLFKFSASGVDRDVLLGVVKSLYRDPLNSYIPFSSVMQVAAEKVRGNSIDERLPKL